MLDDRKLSILNAIINSYYDSAEPVGSRTLSKGYDLGVSSATIRNEMSDLESLGYLNKSHSSSGRIPSDKAYRFYVDRLLDRMLSYPALLEDRPLTELDDFENRISLATKFLARSTNCTAIAMVESTSEVELKNIGLIGLDDNNILFVTVEDTGHVLSHRLNSDFVISQDDIDLLQGYLKANIVGKKLYTIPALLNFTRINDEKYKQLVDQLNKIFTEMVRGLEKFQTIHEGMVNIFNYPEYNDIDKAKEFLDMISDEKIIKEVLGSGEEEIKVSIGSENNLQGFNELAVVSSYYKPSRSFSARVGVIGPRRMNYKEVINQLLAMKSMLFYRN